MKKSIILNVLILFVLTVTLAGLPVQAADRAANFPTKPISLVIPFGAGGSHDAHARIIEHYAKKYLNGKPLVITLKPGGSGAVGSNYVANTRPDGYTLLFGSNGCNTVLPIVEKLPYSRADFVPVARINYSPSVIVAAPNTWSTIQELIADAKKKPGEFSFASSGMFNAGHIAFETFQSAANIKLNHVPMQGGADPQMAVLAGQVPLCGAFADELIDLVADGKLVPLAVTSAERIRAFPEVPSLQELGYDVSWEMWRTVLAPKDTPPEIVAKLTKAFEGICKDPEFIEMVEKMGEEVFYMSGTDFSDFWDKETAKFEGIFKANQ